MDECEVDFGREREYFRKTLGPTCPLCEDANSVIGVSEFGQYRKGFHRTCLQLVCLAYKFTSGNMSAQAATFTTIDNPVETRGDFQKVCISLLQPLVPLLSQQCARVQLGATGARFDKVSAELEGYARPLWGIAALLAGGGNFAGSSQWVEGLKQGTNPESSEFWGWCRDTDQRMVEMCPIGFALAITGDYFWHRFSERERINISNWLGSINDKKVFLLTRSSTVTYL